MQKFSIYDKIDELDINKLKATIDKMEWPKGKRFTVYCDGIEFKIQTNLSKAVNIMPEWGYDAYKAMNSMYCRQFSEDEIRWETDGSPQYDEPRFNRDELSYLNNKQIKTRRDFIIAISNLINNQETMEAIVEAATKKKDGTLHKNRLTRIACSGISNSNNSIYAIVARPKTDTSMSVVFDEVICRPGDADIWANDFISTYHEGLPVSEALKKIM